MKFLVSDVAQRGSADLPFFPRSKRLVDGRLPDGEPEIWWNLVKLSSANPQEQHHQVWCGFGFAEPAILAEAWWMLMLRWFQWCFVIQLLAYPTWAHPGLKKKVWWVPCHWDWDDFENAMIYITCAGGMFLVILGWPQKAMNHLSKQDIFLWDQRRYVNRWIASTDRFYHMPSLYQFSRKGNMPEAQLVAPRFWCWTLFVI